MRVLLVIALLFVFGCEKTNNNRGFVVKINPENYLSEVLLADIAQDIEVIPLQYKEEVLFGEIVQVKTFGDYYILHDPHQTNTLTVFDSQGNYVSSLNKKGQGADEYVDMDIFTFYNDKIYVYSRADRAFVVYSFPDMNFIKKIKTDKYFVNMETIKTNIFCLSDEKENEENYKGGFYYRPETDDFEKITLPSLPATIEMSSPSAITRKNTESIYYVSQEEFPTIYELTDNSAAPVLNIDFGKNTIPAKYWKMEEAIDFEESMINPPLKALGVQNVIISPEQISFGYIFANPETKMLAVYDTQKKEYKIFHNICLHKGLASISAPSGIINDTYISVIYAEEISDLLPDKNTSVPSWAEKIRENKEKSEVFLLKFRLKKI